MRDTGLGLILVLAAAGSLWAAPRRAERGARYQFYRQMDAGPSLGTRRVFGGARAGLADFPAVCALLDRYWSVKCSAAVLTRRWVVTAGHCVTPRVAYVKYDTERPTSQQGRTAAVLYLYRHPLYKVVWEDEGRGMDVTGLSHDLGLVRTRTDIEVPTMRALGDSIESMRRHSVIALQDKDVKVLGFGRTEEDTRAEELFAVPLRMVFCEREAWVHCVCGQAPRAGGRTSGVCTGDSGGPVLFEGTQVAVTSMGPVECASTAGPPEAATSVFTALHRYAGLINSTIQSTDAALRMHQIATDAGGRSRVAPLVLPLLWCSLTVVQFYDGLYF